MNSGDKERRPRTSQRSAPGLVVLGGRAYEIMAPRTLESQYFWDRCLRQGGLAWLELHPDETSWQFEQRIRGKLLDGGVALRLMAAMLVRVGKAWQEEMVGEDEEFIGLLSAEENQEAARQVFRAVVAELARRHPEAPWSARRDQR